MKDTKKISALTAAFVLACMIGQVAIAEEVSALNTVTPVKTGVVIRGVTVGGPAGASGTKTGTVCNFSQEEVGIDGRMLGASVNCRPNSDLAQTLPGLPARFDAYCVMNAPVKSARVIQADVPGNPNHCDLSGITPKDATGQFKGAIWR